jgi:hypothetical protein
MVYQVTSHPLTSPLGNPPSGRKCQWFTRERALRIRIEFNRWSISMLIRNVSKSDHTAAFILPNSYGHSLRIQRCMEQIAEVLEITGNVHGLEGLGVKWTDKKPRTCLNRPVQAHSRLSLGRGTNVEVSSNLTAHSQSLCHYSKTYHPPTYLWPSDSVTVLSKTITLHIPLVNVCLGRSLGSFLYLFEQSTTATER